MKKITLPILIVILLVLIGGIFYIKNKTNTLETDIALDAKKQAQDIVEKVGKLIVLPKDETPTIATISDPEKLKGQAFFAKAKIGDNVLIYTASKKAYLYDSVSNKILEVAPIDFGDLGKITSQNTNTPTTPVDNVASTSLKKTKK